jgi:hypothetical protein
VTEHGLKGTGVSLNVCPAAQALNFDNYVLNGVSLRLTPGFMPSPAPQAIVRHRLKVMVSESTA